MDDPRITTVERSGLTFDVSDAGPVDGPIVVLLHGFPGSHRTWDALVPLLSEAGLRTLALEQRGYSTGARPRRRRDYRAHEVTQDALALLDAVGADRVHVVGHDWGGFVAWRLAAVAPERLSGMTVLSTPHPSALLRAAVSSAQGLRSTYIGLFQLPALPELLIGPRMHRLLRIAGLPRAFAAEYTRFHIDGGALPTALTWYRGMWLPDRRSRSVRGAAVSVDTTYVWGNRDQALGRRAAELTGSHVSGAYRFVELDENHWLPERAPSRVAAEIIAAVQRAR
jgi:pimeloyl-ACP methyl ester carboxylesterase